MRVEECLQEGARQEVASASLAVWRDSTTSARRIGPCASWSENTWLVLWLSHVAQNR